MFESPRARYTTRRHSSSVGLGLWISLRLAEAMGGRLEYERVGKYTEFSLTLPTSRARGSTDAVAPETASRLGRPLPGTTGTVHLAV